MNWIAPVKPIFRPWLRRGRDLARRAIGTEGELQEMGLRLSVLADRQGLLETLFQWRVHGIPKRLENMKLEEASLLASTGDVEDAVRALAGMGTLSRRIMPGPGLPERVSEIACLPGDDNGELGGLRGRYPAARILAFDDESDPVRAALGSSLEESGSLRVLRIRECSVSAALDGRFDLIWLSSALERLTPVQAIILLKRARASRAPDGAVAGYFADFAGQDAGEYFLDPRRIRPLTRRSVEASARACGFNEVRFEAEAGGNARFVLR